MRKTKRRAKKTRLNLTPLVPRPVPNGKVSIGTVPPPPRSEQTGVRGQTNLAVPRPLELRERAQAIPTEPDSTYLDLECLADIISEPLEPVWGSVVAKGAVTVLAGEPGVGKSFVALDIAAAVTRGELGPRTESGDGLQLRPQWEADSSPQESDLPQTTTRRTGNNGTGTADGASPIISVATDTRASDLVFGQSALDQQTSRERYRNSEPNSIANPADPWPRQPFPTRERPNYSEPESIAHPADPRPGQPFPTRERSNYSEPESIAHPADPRPGQPFPTRERSNYSEPESIAHPADPRPGQPQKVLVCSPHYERASMLMRRLVAANADLSLIQTVHGVRTADDIERQGPCWSFQLDRDLPILEQELMFLQGDETDIGLIVIDPFPLGLSGSGARQVRQLQELTARLAEIAAVCQVAVLLVCDALPMADSKRAASITPYPAVEKVAQAVWVVERDPDSTGRRLLLPSKLVDEESSPALAFGWRGGAIEWDGDTRSMTAQEFRTLSLQRARNPLMLEDASELSRAMDWLQARLADGPVQSSLVKQEAQDHEISTATLRRAFCALRIESNRIKNTRHRTWAVTDSFRARRLMGADGGDLSRDVGFGDVEETPGVDCGGSGVSATASCVRDTQVAEAATCATRNRAEEDLGVHVRVHDEHVLEHQSEHVLHSVNHGVFGDSSIGAHGVQCELKS